MDKQLEQMSLRIESKWMEVENDIIADIVRRIRKEGMITSTADYQINRLISMGESSASVEKKLQKALAYTNAQMYELYDKAVELEYVRNKDIYEQINERFVPPEQNQELMQASEAIKKQTLDELSNISKSYGFTVDVNGKKVFTPFADYYQKYIDTAMLRVISGGSDYSKELRGIVTQMTNSGLRTISASGTENKDVTYASGYSNRVPVAVRRALVTGLNQLSMKISEINADKLGTDYFEVDWHPNARPTHATWQGRVFKKQELHTICGLGDVAGLCGANCTHHYFPFLPGISERAYTDEWLDEQAEKEAETVTWRGKEYNGYQAKQKQRQMETSMRAQRAKVTAMKRGSANQEDIDDERIKYRMQLQEYKAFCSKTGNQTQLERVYMDGLGRV